MLTHDAPTTRRPFSLPVRIDLLAVTLLGMAALAVYAVFLGKDANSDFRNFHYYGCYCLLHGRIGVDVFGRAVRTIPEPAGLPAILLGGRSPQADWGRHAVRRAGRLESGPAL